MTVSGGHPAGGDGGGEAPFQRLHVFRAGDLDTKGGRTWAYDDDPGRADIDRATKRALLDFYDENALDPTAFPSLLRIENEVLSPWPGRTWWWSRGGGQLHHGRHRVDHDGGQGGP